MKLISTSIRSSLVGAFTALMWTCIASAHHSYATFDRNKTVTHPAVVRAWEYNNPHAYLWVYINDADGKPQLWGIEGPGPSVLVRSGWNKYTVKPGDKVTVEFNPMRDQSRGGNLIKLTTADGHVLNVGLLPGAPGGTSAVNGGPQTEGARNEAPVAPKPQGDK